MALEQWPDWMPLPLRDGYQMAAEDRRETGAETAGPYFSPGFGGDVCTVTCSLLLSPLQAAFFEQLDGKLLRNGSDWFSFPVWYGGAVHFEACRFKTRPKLSGVNGRFTEYRLELFVRKRTALPAPPSSGWTAWPQELPAPDAAPTMEFEELRLVTETEVGAIVRRQFDVDLINASAELLLTPAQAAVFEAFEKDATQSGRWFNLPVWYAGERHDAIGTVSGRPSWSPEGPRMTRYKFSLLFSERVLALDQCILDVLDAWGTDGLIMAEDGIAAALRAMAGSTRPG